MDVESLPKLKRHGGRLSLADYLNCPEPPFITRKQAIKLRCLDCVGNSHEEVRDCKEKKCVLWRYRLGGPVENADSPMMFRAKAIRQDCMQCCGDSVNERALCPAEKCPTWPYRMSRAYQRPGMPYWTTHRTWNKECDRNQANPISRSNGTARKAGPGPEITSGVKNEGIGRLNTPVDLKPQKCRFRHLAHFPRPW